MRDRIDSPLRLHAILSILEALEQCFYKVQSEIGKLKEFDFFDYVLKIWGPYIKFQLLKRETFTELTKVSIKFQM